jgi:uncharacterized membrane protein YcaP (DUF421 family)
MDSVINAVVVYVFLRLAIGLAGLRGLAQLSSFQLVLLVIVGGAVQRALVGDDPSLTNAAIIVATLIGLELTVSLLERRTRGVGRFLRGEPLIVVENGRPLARRMHRAQVSEDDILAAARMRHGLTSMDEVKYAILEANGEISIVPERKTAAAVPERKVSPLREAKIEKPAE